MSKKMECGILPKSSMGLREKGKPQEKRGFFRKHFRVLALITAVKLAGKEKKNKMGESGSLRKEENKKRRASGLFNILLTKRTRNGV